MCDRAQRLMLATQEQPEDVKPDDVWLIDPEADIEYFNTLLICDEVE